LRASMAVSVVCSTSELSAASGQRFLRSRDAVSAVAEAVAKGLAEHSVRATSAVRLSALRRYATLSGLLVVFFCVPCYSVVCTRLQVSTGRVKRSYWAN